MNIATVAGVALNIAVFANPNVTEAKNWLPFKQEVPVINHSEFNSSYLYSYVDVQSELLQTEIKPAFEEAGMLADRLTLAREELVSYERLDDNWDGNGALPANNDHLRDAHCFLSRLPGGIAIPKPMIGSSGDIGFYWDLPDFYADIAFEGGSAFSIFTKNKVSGVEGFESVGDIGALDRNWFFRVLGRKHNA
ncbi:hypothetical protein KPB05_23005 [Burkholderia gladioli]|uniref:hypothetical protein n=1 Tax=Burkholderia gladioli TaxID=28095 RepID=UPI001641F483|nr:hypothetical protein [Burkholderia gladioli]MDR8090331.1 hypothetical protein [Burkholderia gladioli]